MMSDFKETAEPQETKSTKDDLDMAKIQAAMKGLSDQQEQDLQEDLEKFKNRPKPPWAGEQPPTDAEQVTPMPSELKSEVMRIQNLPVDQRHEAVADYVASLQSRLGNETAESKDLSYRTVIERNGDGISFLDADGNKHTIWYKEGQDND